MSDTPITDANCFGKAAFGDDEKMVSVHVARRLEKSRTPLAEGGTTERDLRAYLASKGYGYESNVDYWVQQFFLERSGGPEGKP
jgi:hypothetical protein